jgi:hypothetical protein
MAIRSNAGACASALRRVEGLDVLRQLQPLALVIGADALAMDALGRLRERLMEQLPETGRPRE